MTAEVAGLLDGSRAPGVYRVLGERAELETSLEQGGWRVAVLEPTATRAAFYREVAAVLAFPGYFGANLDALEESLREVSEATALVLTRWTTLARADPAFWSQLLDVLRERTAAPPPFAVLLT